ncbi:MAG: phosphatase PAP2 family protein [Desulfocurvibacter africanus]
MHVLNELAARLSGGASLLLLLGLLILLRFVVLHVGRLLWETARRIYNRVSKHGVWERTEGFLDELRQRYPRFIGFLDARFTPRRFSGLPLTLLILAAAYIAGLSLELLDEVLEADEVVKLDEAVNQVLAAWRSPTAVTVFTWITNFGSTETLTAVSIVSTGFLFAHRRVVYVLPLWLCIAGSQLTTWAGKYAIAKPRPEFILGVEAFSPSFPSGHATGAAAVYGFIAYILIRDLTNSTRRFEIGYWTAVLVLLVTFSRVFLSVHFLSDLAAGLIVGGFWLLVGVATTELLARRDSGRPK